MSLARTDVSAPTYLTTPLRRITFLLCPTGPFCREDRCQSYFSFELIPSMRAPLEECEAAGAMRAVGAKAAIIDAPAERLSEEECTAKVAASTPQAIVLVTTFGTLHEDLVWAQKLRAAFPSVALGIRGAPCYSIEREILEGCTELDFSVKGEYETIFASLATHGIVGTRGVSYRTPDGVHYSLPGPLEEDLDRLPFPDRSSLQQDLYSVRGLRKAQATVRVQRGCPFPCSYCLVHTVSGDRSRHRSPSHIVDEVCELYEGGVSRFYFRADTFTVDRDWVVSLCEELRRRCPLARWVTTTRVDKVDRELLSMMKSAGCYGLSFGVDVASKAIGKKVHKLADHSKTESALRACDDVRIISLMYLMIGFVWETHETIAETQHFIQSLRPDLLTIHFAHPYPGTKYFNDAQIFAQTIVSKKAQATPAHSTLELSTADLQQAARRMLINHYRRPKVLLSLLRKGLPLLMGR